MSKVDEKRISWFSKYPLRHIYIEYNVCPLGDSTSQIRSDLLDPADYYMGFNPEETPPVHEAVSSIDEIIGEPEPKSNDGRPSCYWCGKKTRKLALAFTAQDYCDPCDK